MIVFQKIREKRYLFVLLMLLFMGAGVFIFIFQNRGGNILTEASPDTSALQLYYFDGKVNSPEPYIILIEKKI